MSTQMILCFVIGAILAAMGLSQLKKGTDKKRACNETTVGTVSDVSANKSHRNDSTGAEVYDYTPTYTYTADGKEYTIKGTSVRDNKNKYRIGDTTTVFYAHNNPATAYIKGTDGKGAGIVMTIIGIGLVVAGFFRM